MFNYQLYNKIWYMLIIYEDIRKHMLDKDDIAFYSHHILTQAIAFLLFERGGEGETKQKRNRENAHRGFDAK